MTNRDDQATEEDLVQGSVWRRIEKSAVRRRGGGGDETFRQSKVVLLIVRQEPLGRHQTEQENEQNRDKRDLASDRLRPEARSQRARHHESRLSTVRRICDLPHGKWQKPQLLALLYNGKGFCAFAWTALRYALSASLSVEAITYA